MSVSEWCIYVMSSPLSPHPGSTAGYPCVSSLIRADRARTPSPAAPSSPQPGLVGGG